MLSLFPLVFVAFVFVNRGTCLWLRPFFLCSVNNSFNYAFVGYVRRNYSTDQKLNFRP